MTAITESSVAELSELDDEFRNAFGSLNDEQLNWRPSDDRWSVAQCIDHLVLTNNAMLVSFEEKVAGQQNSIWENWSPFSRFFGSYLLKSLASTKPAKAPSSSIVPQSVVESGVLDRFSATQTRLKLCVAKAGNLDWDKTAVTSPFLAALTYSFRDAVSIVISHERRHFQQAEQVKSNRNFPSS